MKTPEEWMKQLHSFLGPLMHGRWGYVDLDNIKQIQLDAWRQGMTDAADICKDMTYMRGGQEQAILAARDAQEKPDEKKKAHAAPD